MKKFILHGDMAEHFCENITLNVDTMREVISALCTNFPDFKKYYIDKSLDGVSYIFVDSDNNEHEMYCLDLPLLDKEYHILPSIAGSSGAGDLATGFGQNLVLGYLMSVFTDMLGDGMSDDGTPEYEIITTNSFIYSQNENTVEQGSPVPVVYGQLRVGSKVIQSTIHNYDYDYDNASIYPIRLRGNNFRRIINISDNDYSHTDVSDIIDLRDNEEGVFASPLNPIDNNDVTKRSSVRFGGDNNDAKSKNVSQDLDNEPINQYYGGGGKSNEKYTIGAIEGSSPIKTKPSSSWWNHGSPSTNRPFVWPPAGQKDYAMRPQSANDLCVERPIINGVATVNQQDLCDAWKREGLEMRVGSRGQYQKLESISIHKSLEVLSEGPIVGLANPITGFDRDNGASSFPYGAEGVNFAAGRIAVGTITYDATQGIFVSENNTNDIPIINNGAGYVNMASQTIQANGLGFNGVSINFPKPSSSSEINIGGISFSSPDDPNGRTNGSNNSNDNQDPHLVSNSQLFLLSLDDGELQPNTNNLNTINGFLNSIYLVNETVGDGTFPVFQLNLLERDRQNLNTSFSMGDGFGLNGFQVTINPASSDFNYEASITKSTPFDRVSKAQCLDLSRYANLINDSNFEQILNNEFVNNNASTVPLTNFTWAQMPRIYHSGGDPIQATITIILETASWRVWNGNEWVTSTGSISVIVSTNQYFGLSSVTVSSDIGSSARNQNNFTWTTGYGAFRDFQSTQNQNLLTLMNRSTAFANDLFVRMSNELGGLNAASFNGRNYPRFGVGCGSNISPGARIGSLPAYTLGGDLNFNQVPIVEPGVISEDDSDNPKGYYCPFIFPRITVFMIRKSTVVYSTTPNSSIYICPTNIEAVASVSANGTISAVNLISVPGNCVLDSILNQYTPIIPHTGPCPYGNISIDSSTYVSHIQDVGLVLQIDASHNFGTVYFDVNNGSLDKPNGGDDFFANWSDYIRNNNISQGLHSYPEGIFPEAINPNDFGTTVLTKQFELSDLESNWERPDQFANLSLTLERVNVPGGLFNAITNQTFTSVYTGRVSDINLLNRGVNYRFKNGNANGQRVGFSLYNETYSVNSFDIQNGGEGYAPDSSFFVYGFSNSKVNAVNNGHAYISFKAKILTDKYGAVSDINIIDQGFGFSPLALADDFVFCTQQDTEDAETDAMARGIIPDPNPTNNIFSDTNFIKQPLIIAIDDTHLSTEGNEGKVAKFYVLQNGLGFVFNQFIGDIFADIASFTPPSFTVTIEDNTLQSITIQDSGSGYTSQDTNLTLTFSNPTLSSEGADPADNDPHAWARSIFLNDVPIRDKSDRFNFSKFHFDMRPGHYLNGNLDRSIPDSLFAPEARSSLMNNEFKLPSHTKIVDYPLYGPRNHGEKDFYYTHTIKNPEVTSVSVNFKINELNYVYEGDESAIYVNLIPLVAAGLGIMLGKMLKESIALAIKAPDPIALTSLGKGTAVSNGKAEPCTGLITGLKGATTDNKGGLGTVTKQVGEGAKAAKNAAFYSTLLGTAGGLAATYVLKYLIKCSVAPFLCFKVGEIIKNSGEIWPAKVQLVIEHGTEGSDLTMDTVTIRGCATNPYVKDIVVDLEPSEGNANTFKNRILKIYRITREMDPVSGGVIESRYSISASVHSITEYVEGFFSYPNTALIGTRVNSKDFSNIPKKEYLIKGRVINIPSNYNEVDGTYTEPWNGTFIQQWTSNPAWIIYDLLTNERYGCGKYGIRESDIDKWSFYTFAQFCDERIETTIDGVLNNGAPYLERRHMCNLYVDSEKEAYEYIKDLLRMYNSTINFGGGKIYITKDSSINETGAVMLFNNANISEDGFSYSTTPSTKRITAASIDYLDERDNYMLKTEYVEDQQGIADHGYSHAKMAGTGITRRGEAHRLCWAKILTKQLEKEVINFKSGLQSAYLRIGDVINVMDNNKVAKHSGGRIKKMLNARRRNASFIYDIEIDIPVEALTNVTSILIEVNDNLTFPIWNGTAVDYLLGSTVISTIDGSFYKCVAESISASNTNLDPSRDTQNWSISSESNRGANFSPFTISRSSGFQLEVFTDDENAGSIFSGASWTIELNDVDKISPKLFRVKQIKEVENMEFEIIAIEYIEEKYSQIDSSTSNLNGSPDNSREYSGHEILV